MAERPSQFQVLFDKKMYDVLETIFMNVSPPDLDSCKLVNKQWHSYFKHHFWSISRVRSQLMERKQKLIDENRRTSNYIRTDHSINLSAFDVWSLAANRHWIVVGLKDGRIVIIDSITNDQTVLDPPDGHEHALVALADRSAVVALTELCLVFEDWIQEQAIQLDIKRHIITPKSKSLICQSDSKITVFTKQTGEYKHALIIELNRDVRCFDANDEVVVTQDDEDLFKIWSTGSGQLIKALNVHNRSSPVDGLYLSGMAGESKIFYTERYKRKVLNIDWKTEEQEALPLPSEVVHIGHLCWDGDGSAYIYFREDVYFQGLERHRIISLTKPITLLTRSREVPFDPCLCFPCNFSLTEMGTLVYVIKENEVTTVTSLKYFH